MGSIMHRADGRRVIQWIDGSGKQRQKTVKANTAGAAQRKAERLLAELELRAERQQLGLDARPSDVAGLLFGSLLNHFWQNKGQYLRSPTLKGFLEKHLGSLRSTPATEITTARFDALLAS